MSLESELLAAAGHQLAAEAVEAEAVATEPNPLGDGRAVVRELEDGIGRQVLEDGIGRQVLEVYLVHESGNEGSAAFYDLKLADVLLREGAGWQLGDPATGRPLDAAVEDQSDADAPTGEPDADADAGDQNDGTPPAPSKPNRRRTGEPKE